MMHRYFLIEPLYSDGDTFCSFTVGSGRVRANIQIYADESMLAGVVWALTYVDLLEEQPNYKKGDDSLFDFLMSVIPTSDGGRTVRFRIFQTMTDDGAPFTADIQFSISKEEATKLSLELASWLERMKSPFEWKP
jgi:hypothetical protein